MVTYGTYGKQLYDNGYTIIPIVPNDKRPACGEKWTSVTSPPSFTEYSNCGIGILCGKDNPVYAIDVDVYDLSVVEYLHSVINKISGRFYRIGRDPKRLYLFRSKQIGISKFSSIKYKIGKVEVLGEGQQFVAFGTHPDTRKPYRWPDLSPLSVRYSDLPDITIEDLNAIVKDFNLYGEMLGMEVATDEKHSSWHGADHWYEADNPLFEKAPIGLSTDRLAALVETFDPDSLRSTWLDIGFAIHHETAGEGFDIWDTWSAKGSKYKPGETEYYWSNFGRNDKEPITAAYLLKMHKEKTGDRFEIAKKEENEEPQKDDFFKTVDWSINRFQDELPPIDMIIEGMLPRGITALLFSDGGAGKSTVCLYMAIRIALADAFATDFLGHGINGGSVVLLTAEDPDKVLNRRMVLLMRGIANELNVDYSILKQHVSDRFFIISTFGMPIQLFTLRADKGILKRTPYYVSFVERLKTITNLQLVIIDTKTRFSPGEGSGNVIASNEITYYEMICRATNEASVLLLHHTSKKARDGSLGGQQAYRDATALFDHTRASWYIHSMTPKEIAAENISLNDADKHFIFENTKNNYIQKHLDIVVKRDGYSYTYKASTAKMVSAEEMKDKRRQDAIDAVVFQAQITKNGTIVQSDVVKILKVENKMGRSRVLNAIKDAVEDGLLSVIDRGAGKAKLYCLTDEGKKYKLTIE